MYMNVNKISTTKYRWLCYNNPLSRMSGKRTCESTTTSSILKRKTISLEQKLEIINKYEAGAYKVKIGRDCSMNESTIRTTIARSSTMVEIESLLLIWIEDCNQKLKKHLSKFN